MVHKDSVLLWVAALVVVGGAGCRDARQDAPPEQEPPIEDNKSQIANNTIWHFEQSGFMAKVAGKCLVFDYIVERMPVDSNDGLDRGLINPDQIKDDAVYVFVSHAHGDHFNGIIYTWKQKVPRIKYVLSYDIQNGPQDAVLIHPGQTVSVDDIKVRAYPSSDQGVAFSVYLGGKHVYFAGDNAFWNWRKDRADEDYLTEDLCFLDRQTPIDIAFQVCDPRLDGMGAGGIYAFAFAFQPKLLIPIHSGGNYDFNKIVLVKLQERGFTGKFWPVKWRGDSVSF